MTTATETKRNTSTKSKSKNKTKAKKSNGKMDGKANGKLDGRSQRQSGSRTVLYIVVKNPKLPVDAVAARCKKQKVRVSDAQLHGVYNFAHRVMRAMKGN